MGSSQATPMGTCCFIPGFLRDVMVCPNSDSAWHCLLWSSLDGSEHRSSSLGFEEDG